MSQRALGICANLSIAALLFTLLNSGSRLMATVPAQGWTGAAIGMVLDLMLPVLGFVFLQDYFRNCHRAVALMEEVLREKQAECAV